MYSHHESKEVNHQMLVSSPRCSFNCQGLSIHLPPLGGPRDSSAASRVLSSPMSASFLQEGFDQLSPEQNGHFQQSVSPRLGAPGSGKGSPHSAKVVRVNKSVAHDVRADLKTPSSTEASGPSRLPSSDTSRVLGDSNDELSATSQESPKAKQLVPGAPGVARRAKAHVPSACVNCKKKHLACETKRPCNRCVQTGKESSCVDVQHKKRGRPRLREEESLRGLTFGPEYPTEEVYEVHGGGLPVGYPGRHRSKTYRELRSQPETPYIAQRPSTSDSNFSQQQYLHSGAPVYAMSAHPGWFPSEFTPTMLLTTDFVVIQHNRALSDALSLSYAAIGKALLELVVPAEKERITRLQSAMRAELREACHSPSSYIQGGQSSHAWIPPVEQLDMAHATAGFRTRSEYWTFRLPREQSRGFPISISLARDGGQFVILTLVQSTSTLPSPPPQQHKFQTAAMPVFSPSVPKNSQPPSHPPAHPHQHHHQHDHHRKSLSSSSIPYLISPTSSNLDDQLLQAQPSHSLAQYKHSSPPRPAPLPYDAPRPDSGISGPLSAPIGDAVPHSSPVHPNHPSSKDSLKHLQLPPIRTTPRSDPSTMGALSPKGRRRLQSGTPSPGRRRVQNATPSPARSSSRSGKKKKRRRLEVADMLR